MIFLILLLCVYVCHSAIDGNGGTQVGVSGLGFSILASDRKLIESYSIKSKGITRLSQIDDGLVLSTNGAHADGLALTNILKSAVAKYEHENGKKINIEALSNLLSSVLYARRFNPYSSNCAIAGIDKKGKGALYRYDSVGSFERVPAFAIGNGCHYIQPTLDELVEKYSTIQVESNPPGDSGTDAVLSLSVEEACSRIASMFRAAAGREITLGREIDLCIVGYDNSGCNVKSLEKDKPTIRMVQAKHSIKQLLVKL